MDGVAKERYLWRWFLLLCFPRNGGAAPCHTVIKACGSGVYGLNDGVVNISIAGRHHL